MKYSTRPGGRGRSAAGSLIGVVRQHVLFRRQRPVQPRVAALRQSHREEILHLQSQCTKDRAGVASAEVMKEYATVIELTDREGRAAILVCAGERAKPATGPGGPHALQSIEKSVGAHGGTLSS